MNLHDQEELRFKIIEWGIQGSPSNWERAGSNWSSLVDMYWKEVEKING